MPPWTSKNTSPSSSEVLERGTINETKNIADSKNAPNASNASNASSTRHSMPHIPYEIQTQQEQHTLRIVAMLLAILCLFCLGLFPLVSHTSLTVPPRPQEQIAISSGGGTCTTKQSNIQYLQTSQNTNQQQITSQWTQTGLNKQDFMRAQMCAASFVIAYQSFSFDQAKTFETSTALLTAQAQKRFYGQIPGSTADERMDPLWRAGIQKQQISQHAQVAQPDVLTTRLANKRILAWIHVQYRVTITRENDTFALPADNMTVLMVSLPPSSLSIDTEWQISAWQAGTQVFVLPAII